MTVSADKPPLFQNRRDGKTVARRSPALLPFEWLEPDAGKLARPVLRGEDDGNVILLPD